MEQSILDSTKKILGLDSSYTAFDFDVITHINAAFANLHQMGIGPDVGFSIEDNAPVWADFALLTGTEPYIHMIKTYIYLYVRYLFDPPTTGFAIEAMKNQIAQYEWRLSTAREYALPEEQIV